MKNDSYYETDTHIYFYGSLYSQWAKKDIVIDDIKYCTCEQYMMVEKARMFGDNLSAIKIMDSQDPSVQKALGRKVKNFDIDKWEKRARYIVETANYAKFTQHEDCQRQLMDSGEKIIVEASPYDCIWGVGLRATDPKILDEKNWRGTNWLGEAIMDVRECLWIQKAKGHLSQNWEKE